MRSVGGIVIALGAAVAVLAPADAGAQATLDAEQQAVYAVVKRVFDGMRAKDTTMMRSTFDPSARLLGMDTSGTVRVTPVGDWIGGVGRAGNRVLDERLYDPIVHVDGNLAQVWVKYDLFVDERFSHCGVDAFDLSRTKEGWRITQVADTRRRERCGTPGAPGTR